MQEKLEKFLYYRSQHMYCVGERTYQILECRNSSDPQTSPHVLSSYGYSDEFLASQNLWGNNSCKTFL